MAAGQKPAGCGLMGCTRDAYAKVDHPDHGDRVVCKGHVEGQLLVVYDDE